MKYNTVHSKEHKIALKLLYKRQEWLKLAKPHKAKMQYLQEYMDTYIICESWHEAAESTHFSLVQARHTYVSHRDEFGCLVVSKLTHKECED